MQIRRAERKKAKLRLGITGASGSGKTMGALEIAKGMGGKIGMIDTESGRGELYANNYEYDVIRLEAPYTTDKYISAIKLFEKNDYDILIIDSMSHAWIGEGGVLSVVDNGGGWFAAGGRKGSSQQNALVDAIISSKMHIITTLRAKTEYVIEKNDKGKNEPRKIGLAPVQRDGLEYEFTVFMSMSQENIAHVTKDNTQLFNNEFFKLTPQMGEKLMTWLNEGSEPAVKVDLKEQFITIILPEIIKEFEECYLLDDLQQCFNEQRRKYGVTPDHYASKEFIEAKDKRKEEIISEEIVEEQPLDMPPIATAFKNSQTLTQLAQGI